MGIKKKRISVSDIIFKNGKKYAKESNRIRPLCDCMVFYKNCMKCNIKLAKRHSDYISLMLKHCREASESRRRTRPMENHDFCPNTFYKYIYDILSKTKMMCQCDLCLLHGSQEMSVRGRNKLSLDRIYDNIGYTHKVQKLRFVSKNHHSWQKRDSVPIKSTKRNWLYTVRGNMIERSKARYKRLSIEIDNVEKSGLDATELKEKLKTHIINIDECSSILKKKKESTPNCSKCGINLDYGDKDGYVYTTCESRRASPDRVDNRLGYIDSNLRMVCFSCQTIESIDDRDDLFLTEEEFTELLEYIKSKISY